MLRLLMLEDDISAAELALHALQSAKLPCTCERAVTEAEFRAGLARSPDFVLSDSNVPGFDGMEALDIVKATRPRTPFIFLSGHMDQATVQRALERGAAEYVPKSELGRLPGAVRAALGFTPRRAVPQPPVARPPVEDSAEYLLQRQAAVDRSLKSGGTSRLSSLLTHTPPTPAALVMIDSAATRDRYIKLLHTMDIEIDILAEPTDALRRLVERLHVLLFTDRLDLIRDARQLEAGSAIHIVFVHAGDDVTATEGLRAGANEVMPEDGRGERFWAHLTTARRIVSFAESLQSAVTDNRLLSTLDELTAVGNRRYFEHQWPREVTRSVRFRRPLSLLMCDIDHFKSINDRHGHPVGDEVLRQFGERITGGLRLGEDWVARIGGEEFAIVLPETGQSQARAIAERLRAAINATQFRSGDLALSVTASFGISSLAGSEQRAPDLHERIVTLADDALYQSKRSGRNRVSESDQASTPTGTA